MIALCCGGTGGHIYPAIALAQEIGSAQCFFFISQDRVDSEIVSRYGFQTVPISFSKAKKISGLFKAFRQASQALRTNPPKAVIATGGYFTVPIILAAYWNNIPVYLLEQNLLPGRVNRYLSVFAKVVYTSFDQSRRYFAKRVTVKPLGNPVRSQFLSDSPDPKWGSILHASNPMLLVIGGSQGAAALNRYVIDRQSEFIDAGWNVVHLMGPAGYKAQFGLTDFEVVADGAGQPRLVFLPYFEGMDQLYRAAKAVMARAGATTLAELRHFNVPAILVPFPFAKDDHQRVNAEVAELEGGAITVTEAALEPLSVAQLIHRISEIKPFQYPKTQPTAKAILYDIGNGALPF